MTVCYRYSRCYTGYRVTDKMDKLQIGQVLREVQVALGGTVGTV